MKVFEKEKILFLSAYVPPSIITSARDMITVSLPSLARKATLSQSLRSHSSCFRSQESAETTSFRRPHHRTDSYAMGAYTLCNPISVPEAKPVPDMLLM
jgi:hypothetical protein